MIINLLPICYQPDHQPFTGSQAANCQTVDSEKPVSKLIRAVLRVSEVDPATWTQYSIHRCYCKSKGKEKNDLEDELDSSKTLDQLGIREGDSIFFRKRNDRMDKDEVEEDQDEVALPLSRKRKERDEDEVTSQSAPLPSATNPKSSLENLEPRVAATARTISKLLEGDAWKTQSIGKLGLIKTKSANCLQALLRAIKTSLQIPQVEAVEAGLFNTDLMEALARPFHQRVGSSIVKIGENHFFDLDLSDFEKANELLKGKIEGDGSWERGSLSHLDQSALSKPAAQFPLSNSGLSGQNLNTARAVSAFWNNYKWVNQPPLPGLSPISLKGHTIGPLLRQFAQLTRIEPGEDAPDGFPPIALEALRKSIKSNQSSFEAYSGGSQAGWSQSRCLKDALALLKKRVTTTSAIPSSNAGRPSEASGSRGRGERQVRRRLDGGK